MIIWGWRRYVQTLAMVTFVCGQCGNPAAHALRRFVTKFTLFFVPLFPVHRRFEVQCTFCGATGKVTKEQADGMRAQSQQPDQPVGPPQPGQQYPAQQYPAQQYGAQQFGAQQYGAQQFGAPQHPAQQPFAQLAEPTAQLPQPPYLTGDPAGDPVGGHAQPGYPARPGYPTQPGQPG